MVKKKRRFTNDERDALNITSKEAFEKYWQTTLGEKTEFEKSHEKGVAGAGKKITNQLASAQEIVENFAPLMEIVKALGAPFGGMAFGTLLGREDQINSTLVDIQNRLPGFRMYQNFQTGNTELEEKLQDTIVEAYKSFIDFSIEVSRFYSQRAITRWLKALSNTTRIETTAATVGNALLDVRRVCDELVDQNIHDIKIQNEKTLISQHAELLHRQYTEKLQKLRVLLQVERYSPENYLDQLAKRRRDVAAEYDTAAAFECVEMSESFKDWLHSATSQVFVLSGHNDSYATHCWLSPVALKLIAEKTSSASSNPANICIFEMINLRNENTSFEHITRSLIYQLILSSKHGLSKEQEVEKLDRDMEKYSRLVAKSDAPMHQIQETLAKILAQSLTLFDPGTTVWVIIDRADQCRTARANETSGTKNQQRKALMRTLVHAVEQSPITMKILVVVNTSDWDVQKYADDFGQEKEESLVIEKFKDENYIYG
ncbi:hypothetical protein DM02DRAFT_590815 [Periconia macrospinosa]|uniref:Nephrocystin 3-like N-terminal domain-containing protein n=1 Tax=Periconia macrospinosa TaxID=97972 RepID=A0A2V1DUE8_9PLEO|nr:hypothetical protein DM02DRAFT_590815 [Periconia macrospinosa]